MRSTKKRAAKKRPGPAPQGEYADKSKVLSTRITSDLREWLEQAAKKSGRTLSQEIENRLRQTFVEEERLIERFGSERTARVLQVVANVLQGVRNPDNPSADWLDDPRAFEDGINAINWTLEAVRPPHPPDWYELERIREFDAPSKWNAAAAANASRRVWRDIEGSGERALPLNVRMTPQQRLSSIIRNKIPEIVERSKIIAPGTPLAAVTNSNDEPSDFTVEEVEATNRVRRENYYCIYCEELYPKNRGSKCPKCKGLDLSGRKHGGDGRQIKPLSPDDPSTYFALAEMRHADREE